MALFESYNPIQKQGNLTWYENPLTLHGYIKKIIPTREAVREIQVMKDLQCDLPAKLIHYEIEGEMTLLYFEVVTSETLEAAMLKIECENDLIPLIKAAMSALNVIHQKEYLHMRLTPQSIFFSKSGEAFFTDYTSASRINEEKHILYSNENLIYLAPECLFAPEKINYASDYYALAMSFLRCLSKPLMRKSPLAMKLLHELSALSIEKRPLNFRAWEKRCEFSLK